LLNALVMFSVHTQGFTHAQLRTHLANLLGINPGDFGAGRMTYDLRRLRLHGPGSDRNRTGRDRWREESWPRLIGQKSEPDK
jgi:hypothetical protein